MTIEQNLKNLLGEYCFQLCVLQAQIADLNKRLEEKKEKNAK